MRPCRLCIVPAFLLVGLAATRADAQITSHFVNKTAQYYYQTTDNVAAPLSGVTATAGLLTNNAGDVASADVTFPGAGSATALTHNGTQWTFFGNFASTAAANAAFPNGNYLFHTAGGTVGTTNDTLALQSSYPAEGVFTGTSITDLTTMNPNGPIHITFNGFTPDPALNSARIGIQLSGGPQVFQSFDPAVSATGFTFPAGTFVQNTNYYLTLEYFNDNVNATGQSDYSSYTAVNFTTATVPEPAGMALFGAAASLAAILRRRRTSFAQPTNRS